MSNNLFLLTDETTDLAQCLLRLQMEKEVEAQAAREAENLQVCIQKLLYLFKAFVT